MTQNYRKAALKLVAAFTLTLLGSCATTPPPPTVAPYNPNFHYSAESGGGKLDVTIGVVAPQFSGGSQLGAQQRKSDPLFKALQSSMSATFNELLIAKGFTTKGPFVSLSDMTFPEKKGSDLLLYPEFDFQINLHESNAHLAEQSAGDQFIATLAGNHQRVPECDITLSVTGNVLFVAQEPLSGERMWVKRLDVSSEGQTFHNVQGSLCAKQPPTQDIKNAWNKAHEIVYQTSMKALDSYVNGEEFQLLKKQSLELRAKKAY
jgi:hypothetical protein